MCYACMQIEQLFSKFRSKDSKKNNDIATEYLKYLSLHPEQRCEFTKNFDFTLFTETDDSKPMDGKPWHERLQESFKEIDSLYDSIEAGTKAMDESPWALPEEVFKSLNDPELTKSLEAELEVLAKNADTPVVNNLTSCTHEWFEYQGAGTRPPETICRKCGSPKTSHKASP